MPMIYSVNDIAREYAARKVPAPAERENDPRIIQLRDRHAFNYKVTAFNFATATLIGSVALAVLVSFNLFFVVGCAAFLGRNSIMKDLCIQHQPNQQPYEPRNSGIYKNLLRNNLGFALDNQWLEYAPVEVMLLGYQLRMNTVPVPPEPAEGADAPANANAHIDNDGNVVINNNFINGHFNNV